MSKRLQVLMDEHEWDAIEGVARRQGKTVSEWVRETLRAARREEPSRSVEEKLAVLEAAIRRDGPTADIDQMLAEIEAGYLVET